MSYRSPVEKKLMEFYRKFPEESYRTLGPLSYKNLIEQFLRNSVEFRRIL